MTDKVNTLDELSVILAKAGIQRLAKSAQL